MERYQPVETEKLSKRDRFKKYAPRRTQTAIDALRRLGNCANTASYEYDDEEKAQILHAIGKAVAQLEDSFDPPAKADSHFAMKFTDGGPMRAESERV